MPSSQHKRNIEYSGDFPWEDKDKDDVLREELERKIRIDEKKAQEEASKFGEVIYGRNLSWYKDIALWPMFLLLIIELGIRIIQTKYLFLWDSQIFAYILLAARILLFFYLAVVAIKRYNANKVQTIFAGTLGGLVLGFVLAVFQLFWYFQLWTVFNLIGGPLLMALIGTVVTWLTYILFSKQLTKLS